MWRLNLLCLLLAQSNKHGSARVDTAGQSSETGALTLSHLSRLVSTRAATTATTMMMMGDGHNGFDRAAWADG